MELLTDDANEVKVSSAAHNLGRRQAPTPKGSYTSQLGAGGLLEMAGNQSSRFLNLNEDYIPMQEITLLLYRVKRRHVLSDGRRFAILFISFLVCAFMVYSPNTTWEQTTSVMDPFLDEEFPSSQVYKNFFSVATHEEVWEWTEEVWASQLFPKHKWYSGREFTKNEIGYTMYDHKVLGGAQIRLIKVQSQTCESVILTGNVCRSRFTELLEDTQPFYGDPDSFGNGEYNILLPGSIFLRSGSNVIGISREFAPTAQQGELKLAVHLVGTNPAIVSIDTSQNVTTADLESEGFNVTDTPWGIRINNPWTGPDSLGVGWLNGPYAYSEGLDRLKGRYGYGEWGDGTWYGHGGFIITLDPKLEQEQVLLVLQKLKADTLTDSNTRILQFEFNLVNFNTGLFTSVRLKFEHMESTKFLPSHQISTFRLNVYEESTDQIRFVFEIIYIVILTYNLLHELKLMWLFGPIRYMVFDLRNPISLFFIFLNGVALYYWFLFLFNEKANHLRTQLEQGEDSNEYISGFSAGYAWEHAFMMGGFVAICSCVHIFRLASLNERGRIMWKTFTRSLIDLILYFIILIAFLLAFAVAAMWIFGSELAEFHDLSSSLSSVTRWCLGDFDYLALSRTAPKAAGPVFYLYSFIIFIFFLNIIVAVLVEAYETTTEEMEKDKTWMRQMPSLFYEVSYDLRNVVKQFFLNVLRTVACVSKGKTQDVDGDGVADIIDVGWVKNLRVSTEWEREAKLFYAMSKAYRAAKYSKPGIDLFEYMLESFKAMQAEDEKLQSESGSRRVRKSYFITRRDFCVLVNDRKTADRVFDAYGQLKTVTLINGSESRVHNATFAYDDQQEDTEGDNLGDLQGDRQNLNSSQGSFKVVKTNRQGKNAERIVLIDFDSFYLRIFNKKWQQKRRIPMRDLVQIERSVIERKRLKLVFNDIQSAIVSLRFETAEKCDDFELLAKSATQMAMSL